MNEIWDEQEEAQIKHMLSASFIGSPSTIDKALQSFIANTGINELMANAHIYDFNARLYSYDLLGEVMNINADKACMA